MPPYGKWTPEEDARLVTMLSEGKTVKEAAAELGRGTQVVYSHMHYRGFTKKSIKAKVREAQKDVENERKNLDLATPEEELARYLPDEIEGS